jgi:hypothetical protein
MDESAIIIRLLGGLGNQLFQYAIGRHLSLIHNRPLKLDLSYYSNDKPDAKKGIRIYCLKHFNIKASQASHQDTEKFSKFLNKKNLFSRLLRRANAFGDYINRSYIFEPPKNYFKFDSNLLKANLKPTVYLDGYWQAEKYFLAIEDIIREDFKFISLPDAKNQEMINLIQTEQSVCIHIRHGDNATKLAAIHGVLPLAYYEKAILDLTTKITNPKFYIFSDDPVWAKENLKLNYPCTFVSHNGDEKNYEDLRLMVNCKHHIIGNSTFSWWGAWLGKKPDQLVYAPKRYLVNTTETPQDLYPTDWNLIEI